MKTHNWILPTSDSFPLIMSHYDSYVTNRSKGPATLWVPKTIHLDVCFVFFVLKYKIIALFWYLARKLWQDMCKDIMLSSYLWYLTTLFVIQSKGVSHMSKIFNSEILTRLSSNLKCYILMLNPYKNLMSGLSCEKCINSQKQYKTKALDSFFARVGYLRYCFWDIGKEKS